MARPSRFVGLKWELSGCVGTFYDEDDVLRAKKDSLGDKPGEEAFEVHAPFGEIMRPLDAERGPDGQPIPNRMCTMLHATDGDEQHAWMCEDPRIIEKLPRARPGERLIHGYGAQFVRFHADGTITLWTSTTNEPEGQGIFFQVGPLGLRFESPFGTLTFDVTGFHVRDRSGARIDAGSAGLPAPFSSIGSYAGISGGIVSVEGAATALGTDGGALSKAGVTALVAYLIQVAAALASGGHPAPLDPATIAAINNIGKVV